MPVQVAVRTPRIELYYFEGCPHAAGARAVVRRCLERLRLTSHLEEHEGDYPSPSVLVDGFDVMGRPERTGRCCRLDLPTDARVMAALPGRSPGES
jgi:hypothetical protein